ncbi:MAG: formate dehydrogenase accessory sulfurtransferase FdhD [Xylophilus ampelinus]
MTAGPAAPGAMFHAGADDAAGGAEEGGGLPAPMQLLPVERQRLADDGAPQRLTAMEDSVAAEVPVALVFNGISQAVMMCTPQDLEDFALGFALSEGILDAAADCRDIAVRPVAPAGCAGPGAAPAPFDEEAPAVEVHLEISARSFARLKDRRRTLAGRTGCGVCGVDSLAALDLAPERVAEPDWLAALDLRAVRRAFADFRRLQPLNARAGSLHAAGWALPDGRLAAVLEDVGRHNALDKLLGRLAREGRLGGGAGLAAAPGFVVMSSRASYELVRKCARMGIPALATISAPTGLAVRIAEQAGMRLWGLCRGDAAVLYAPAGSFGAEGA